MFDIEHQMKVMKTVTKWTYIILVALGIAEGVVCGIWVADVNYDVRAGFITGLIVATVLGLLGYLWAWLADLITYTTVVRCDEILLEMRDMKKSQEDMLSQSLADIKETLARNTTEMSSQVTALTKWIELMTVNRAGNAQSIDSNAQARSDVKPKESMSASIAAASGVNARDKSDYTALMYAVMNNADVSVVKALLVAGDDVNARSSDGSTALMLAARFNTNPDVVKTLIDAGADDARDKKDWIVLMQAASNNTNPDVIKVLLAAGV